MRNMPHYTCLICFFAQLACLRARQRICLLTLLSSSSVAALLLLCSTAGGQPRGAGGKAPNAAWALLKMRGAPGTRGVGTPLCSEKCFLHKSQGRPWYWDFQPGGQDIWQHLLTFSLTLEKDLRARKLYGNTSSCPHQQHDTKWQKQRH